MSSSRILLLLSGLFTGLFASCQKYENLDAEAFCARLADDAVQLLDVRTPEEFSAGHLPGAANIDWLADGFIDGASAALDKARPVAVYCRSGKRSAESAAALTKAGFQVVNLLGGYAGWTAEGRPAVTGEQDAIEAQYAVTLLAPGTQAPDFTLADLDGKPVKLSDFRGRCVVLDFWASWCPDCRAEIPELKQLAAESDPAAVQFVSVSFDRAFETLRAFVAEQQLPGTQLFEPAGKADSAIGAAFGVKWIPSLYLIGPDGSVLLSTVHAGRIAAALRGYPARLLTHSAIHAPASAPAAASASIQPCEDESCAL